jgi:tRNA modification GTPase
VVVNKLDLPDVMELSGLQGLISSRGTLRVSATRGDGIPNLAEAVRKELFNGHGPDMAEPLVSKVRHQKALQRSLERIQKAFQGLKDCAHLELAAEDLRQALQAVGEVTGQTYSDEVLESIFSQFCIGK